MLVVVALRLIDPEGSIVRSDASFRARFKSSVGTVLVSRPRLQLGRLQPLSAYLRFWLASASALLLNPHPDDVEPFLTPQLPAEALPIDAEEGTRLALQRACATAYDDVCRHLAYRAAGDTNTFDVVVLAYSLMTYVLVLDALGVAASSERDSNARDAIGTGTSLPPRNERLIQRALADIFEEMHTGLWPAGQPIVMSRGAGNNVGNAYVFTPDLLASLIEVIPAAQFRPHITKIEEHVAWLNEHVVTETLPTGNTLRGWRSNHLPPEGGPLGWATAQALRCIARIHTLSRELLVADVLSELGGRLADSPDPSAWARLLDSDLPPSSESTPGWSATLKATIEDSMIEPLSAISASDPLGRRGPIGLDSLEASASYSAILFGPPGTAKTTVVAAIAKRLGWGFVTIDTSTFLQDGMSNVASRISYVFERLLALDRVVVLFDEIEEFVLDRSNPSLMMESRMLTTAMLTKLADLRGKRRVAFFIATNRLTALDAAVTRPGRFDMQLFVGTPNLPARMSRFRAKLDNLATPPVGDAARDALSAFESVLTRRWEDDAMFLTYLETERLAADAATLVGARSAMPLDPLDDSPTPLESEFDQLLDMVAATMTVRGSVRDDFLESRILSRT